MNTTPPTYRRPLNKHQIQLLVTLYKFRFITAQLIKDSQNANYIQVINSKLKILYDQEYIGRHYDSSYKLQGKQATYYLLPKAIKFLKEQPFASPEVINSLYHDKRLSEQHIEHSLNVFRAYIGLKHKYRNRLKFYSKSELYSRKHMPEYLPDALVVLEDQDNKKHHYFLDYYDPSRSYVQNIVKVNRYIEYAESEQWQKHISSKLPTILMICETKLHTNRMKRLAEKQSETTYVDLEFQALTSEQIVVNGVNL
jgi:hypothetical protein